MTLKPKGILFSGPMVIALLNGTKSQTRRLVKPQPKNGQPFQVSCNEWETSEGQFTCPYPVGSVLYVKESHYWDAGDLSKEKPEGFEHHFYYRADGECCDQIPECQCASVGKPRWRPSIFMPRWAARIWLQVTAVRVERVCDISEADALAEGITWPDRNGQPYRPPIDVYGMSKLRLAAERYRELWTQINGADTWQNWVFAYTFTRIERPKDL